MQEELKAIQTLFRENRNEADAVPMAKYMKNQFPFLGIKTPLRRQLIRQFFQETGILKKEFNREFVWALWKLDEREFQFAALDYTNKMLAKLKKADLPFMEQLLLTKSWWDTVDTIAPKAVGQIAKAFPEVIGETIDGWSIHENFWLRRAAILFQLKYKEETDEALLYQYLRANATEKEFFIRKAIGWALREYSKTNPASVKKFIESEHLSPLSVREGSKYI